MLTNEILKEHLITAYFIDNERENIEVLTRSEDGKKVIPTIIPFDEKNPSYIALTKHINLDQLHELTYQKNKKQREEFEASMLRIANKEGLVFDKNKIDTKFYPYLVKSIFEDNENPDHLFALKLALFEIEKIRESDNEEQKTNLRKSKNKLEAIQAALDLIK